MHWSDLEHLIAFIKLKIIYWFFKKRHKIKGKIISLYLVEITIRKLRYCSLNTPHCPKSIPCGAILCCSCIRRLNTKVHASFIRGNKTKPISLPSNTAVAISIWSHQGASALTPTTPHHTTNTGFVSAPTSAGRAAPGGGCYCTHLGAGGTHWKPTGIFHQTRSQRGKTGLREALPWNPCILVLSMDYGALWHPFLLSPLCCLHKGSPTQQPHQGAENSRMLQPVGYSYLLTSLWVPGYGERKKHLENPSGLLFLCCIFQMLIRTAEGCLCYDTTQDVSKFGYGTLLRHLQGMGFDLIAKQSWTRCCPALLQHAQHQQHCTCPPLTKATHVCQGETTLLK